MKKNVQSLKTLALTLVMAVAGTGGIVHAQTKFPDFPPKDVTNEMDRDQMLFQMGIAIPEFPPRLEDFNAPKYAFPRDSLRPEGNWTDAYGNTIVRSAWGLWNNYHDVASGFFPGPDSARLGNYPIIDLLTMKDGTKINTSEEWWTKRRPEILKDVQEQLYGAVPPKEFWPKVDFNVVTTTGGSGSSAYIQKDITGEIDISGYPEVRDIPRISGVLRIPATATVGVPVLVVFGGFGNILDRYWEIFHPHGWGICVFNPNALQPDNGVGLTSYLIGLLNKGNWRKPSDWGSIAAWSWGVSRLVDYFETDDHVDASKIGLTGHSRYGKATLVAMAYDTRLAIGFPSDAGSLGTTPTRRHWGQDLEHSTGPNEYHWMAGNFFKWAGEKIPGQYLPRKVIDLDVDSYSLLALCAPRPLLFNGGNQSTWTDPYGIYLTTAYATPVYKLLGKRGIVMPDEKPRLDVGYIEGDLAYRYHNGGHTPDPEWPAFFAFASKYIQAPILETAASFVNLTPEKGSSATLPVRANQSWEVSGGEKWLSVTRREDTLVFTARKHKADLARSATITLTSPGRRQNILVNQGVSRPELTVSSNELTIGETELAVARLDIQSNTAWKVASSEGWLTVVNEAGSNDQSVVLRAVANPGVEKRTATLTVSAKGREDIFITVTQIEGPPTLNVNARMLNLAAAEGSSAGFWVISNTHWELECPASWITPSIRSGSGFGRITISAGMNSGPAERTAEVRIKVKGLPDHILLITQSGE